MKTGGLLPSLPENKTLFATLTHSKKNARLHSDYYLLQTITMLNIMIRRTCYTFVMLSLANIACAGRAGAQSRRFQDLIFEKVSIRQNLVYNDNPPAGVKAKHFRFDLYEPNGDTAIARPLIIWLHGGGFKYGKKTSGGLPLWSETFARRGYACAAINYRLSSKHPLKHFEDLVEACADAVDDVNNAIRFFKTHYQQFRIDTNRIILGGNSAGGMIALQAVYSSRADMARLIHRGDSSAAAVYNPQHVAAIINYWGALFNAGWLKHARVPVVSAHGSHDRVVSYDNKKPPLIGSLAIHRQADSLRIPNNLKIFEGYGHELQKHFNPLWAGPSARKRWLIAGQFAADFLYAQFFQ
jgi:poly(3-hydroxybutyrate) depolymerase